MYIESWTAYWMLYRMKEDDGNGDGSSVLGNPYISGSLCAAYRETMKNEIGSMEEKILSSVKLTGAVIAIVVTLVQLGLYFLGG